LRYALNWCLKGGVMKRNDIPSKVGLALLRAYQIGLSPIFYALGVRCRHEPSCSHYATDCVREQGLWRGSWLAFGRVCRCRPGGSWGYDPAPEPLGEVPWWRIWALRHSLQKDDTGCIVTDDVQRTQSRDAL